MQCMEPTFIWSWMLKKLPEHRIAFVMASLLGKSFGLSPKNVTSYLENSVSVAKKILSLENYMRYRSGEGLMTQTGLEPYA